MTGRSLRRRGTATAAIVLGTLVSAVMTLTRMPTSAGPPGAIPLDASWLISLATTLQQGQWSGRDYYWTFGPLAQVLAQIGTLATPGHGAIAAYPMIWLTFALTGILALAVALTVIRVVPWGGIVVIYGIMLLLSILPGDPRPALALLCVALLYRAATAETTRGRVLLGILTGTACVGAQLVTADLGVLTMAPALASLALCAWRARRGPAFRPRPKQYLWLALLLLAVGVAENLALDLGFAFTSPLYAAHPFAYQEQTIALFRGYNDTMGSPWSLSPAQTTLLACVVVYALARLAAAVRALPDEQAMLPVALTPAALAYLKSALVRSDLAHVLGALAPLIVVVLVTGPWQSSRRALLRDLLPWGLCVLAILAAWPALDTALGAELGAAFAPQAPWRAAWQGVAHPVTPESAFAPAGLAAEIGVSSRPLLDFPYETYIAAALDRPTFAPVLQSYAAGTPSLQRSYVDAMRRVGNRLDVVYGLESVASAAVDGVQAITRVPLIFEYLYTHFRLRSAHTYGGGFYLLIPRRVPRALVVVPVPLRAATDDARLATAVLRQPTSCGLVRLTLEAHYPLTRLLGRTDGLVLAFWEGRRLLQASRAVPLEAGRSFTTYVSLLPPQAFYRVYDDGLPPGPRWDRLTLGAADSGLFGVAPVDLGVRQVACIQG